MIKEELKEIISRYNKEDVEFGKDIDFLCFRNNCFKEDFLQEIFSLKCLEFIDKQEKSNEERLALYFIYSRSRGRVYVLKFFSQKIRIITIFPLGKRTLNKYFKRKFKKG